MTQHAEEWIGMARARAERLDRPAGGDFDAVFRQQYEGLFRFLFRQLGSRTEAEDVAQEAFLRLWRQPPGSVPAGQARAWLYRVALNVAVNLRRGEGRRSGREQAAGREEPLPAPEDPAAAAQRALEREEVRRTLSALPERQARLLLLRHAGLSYQELAEVVGVAPASVGTLLARAELAFESAHRPHGEQQGAQPAAKAGSGPEEEMR
jgi:RNA polymerase sigma-70 factor (ECF subfamily)